MCPPGSLHDQMVRQLPYVRSYILREGRLYLSLMADGGIYEFEPVPGAEGSPTGTIRGTATYRERMALPPDAVLEATLEDVSTADAPADVVAQVRVENPGNPPIRFAIPYDRALVDPARRYTVRARISVDGKPLFTTDRHYPVLGSDGSEDAELLLRRAGPTRRDPPAAGRSLEGTSWKLTHLEGDPVSSGPGSEPHLRFDAATGRVSGSGGCNQLGGGYQVAGDRLELTRMVGTLMACAGGMETEKAFLDALGRVAAWRISDSTLTLLDESGAELARFEGRGESGGNP
jgi:putative lipoprotein